MLLVVLVCSRPSAGALLLLAVGADDLDVARVDRREVELLQTRPLVHPAVELQVMHVVLPLFGLGLRDGRVVGRGGSGRGRGRGGGAGRALGVELGRGRVDLPHRRGGGPRAAGRVGCGPALDDAGGVVGAVAPPAVDEGADLEREQAVGGLEGEG